MWYRSGVVVLLGSLSGCGDSSAEGRESPASEEEPEGAAPPPEGALLPLPETGLTLMVDGFSTQLGAKAELKVTEGQPLVRLEITGSRDSDVLLLDVAFDGIEASMGPHRVEVGLPGTELDSALASIDGKPYQSQTGYIALSLTAEGGIYGNFEVGLAEVVEVQAGLPVAFEAGEVVRTLSGSFNGYWELFCQSRLPGHSTLTRGGDFCEELVIE